MDSSPLLTLPDWRRAYASGAAPRELLGALQRRLERESAPGVWITRCSGAQIDAQVDALEARAAEHPDRAAALRALPLFGVPFAVKDNIDVAGMPTNAACPAFEYVARADAAAVAKLVAAGAMCIGKTNLDQIATGLVGTRSPYGRPGSALAPERVSGGSSSGSAIEPTANPLAAPIDGLRIGALGGYFDENAGPEARAAVERIAAALGTRRRVELPEVARARAAAFLITNAEGSALHLPDLRARAADFEPLSRDRFLAGALLPAAWIVQAQRLRRWFALRAAELFGEFDVLIAAATPCPAPTLGTEWLTIDGRRLPARPSLGLLTQPISLIGLPVCTVPVWGCDPQLPIGVQLIAAPWREDRVLRVAHHLQRAGVVDAPVAPPAHSMNKAMMIKQ